MIAKAHACACLIFRYFVSKGRHSLIKAFITYVRLLVEYASMGKLGISHKFSKMAALCETPRHLASFFLSLTLCPIS